jgi:hypothetical protein
LFRIEYGLFRRFVHSPADIPNEGKRRESAFPPGGQ